MDEALGDVVLDDESNEWSIVRPVSVIALLQFIRIPLLCKWAMRRTMAARHVRSPPMLSWQHSMPVKSNFRAKYLFTRYPLEVMLITTLIALVCGAFTLHCIEPALKASYWRAFFETCVLMVDSPYTDILTVQANLCSQCVTCNLSRLTAVFENWPCVLLQVPTAKCSALRCPAASLP